MGIELFGQTARHLQQRCKEHVGNKGLTCHFTGCGISLIEDEIILFWENLREESTNYEH